MYTATSQLDGVIRGVHELNTLLSHPAPCTPANVGYIYSCETGIAFLSWDETLGRNSFSVHVSSEDHTATCITSQTDCSLPSLLCGHTYDVEVIGVANHCNSSVPGTAQIQTGKRVRMGVMGYLCSAFSHFFKCVFDAMSGIIGFNHILFPYGIKLNSLCVFVLV